MCTVTSNWISFRDKIVCVSFCSIWPIYFFFSIVRKHLNCRCKSASTRSSQLLSDKTMRFHVVTFIFTQKPSMTINSIRIKIFNSGILLLKWKKKTDFCFLSDHQSVTTPTVRWIKQTFRNDCAQFEKAKDSLILSWKINKRKLWVNTIGCTAGSNWKR